MVGSHSNNPPQTNLIGMPGNHTARGMSKEVAHSAGVEPTTF